MHRNGRRFRPELFRSKKVHSYWASAVTLCHRLPASPSFREDAMHKASLIIAFLLMLSLAGSDAGAQIAPQQTPSPQQTPPLDLTPSQVVLAPAPNLTPPLEQRPT